MLRDARLKALRCSPEAFCGNYARERLVHRRTWRRRARTGQWTVARSGGEIVGLAGLLDDPDQELGALTSKCIESVWVHPERRRRGLVRHMLGTIEEKAYRQGVGTLVLYVLTANQPAREVYRRLGYHDVGLDSFIEVRRGWQSRPEPERRLVKSLV